MQYRVPFTADRPGSRWKARVSFTRVSAPGLRTAIAKVLEEACYRDAARRVRDDYVAAGGVAAAVENLVSLARSGVRIDPTDS